MHPSLTHAEAVAVAQGVLSEVMGGPVPLALVEVISDYEGSRNAALRCRLPPGPQGPASAVVKYSKTGGGHLLHEWANLEFLGSIPGARDMVAGLYAGDRGAGLLVIEDLAAGDGRLLGEVLEDDDPVRAASELIGFGRVLGRLHAATLGQREEYRRIEERFGAPGTREHAIYRLPVSLDSLAVLLETLGVRVPSELGREVAAAAAELREPGPFLAFTHGDATPANVLCTSSGQRLFDLETGGYRHALLDGTYPRIRYLYSVWARLIPEAVQRRMLQAYREELVRGCAEAADDDRWNRAFASCALAWLAALCAFLPTVREGDKRWGRSTLRQRIVAGLDNFAAISAELAEFSAAGEAAHEAAKRLRRRWGDIESTMPIYKAFRHG